MVTCSRTLARHPGPQTPCGQSPVHEQRHDDVWRCRHPLRRLHQWPPTTIAPHAQMHAQCIPAMQQDLLLARGGSGRLYRRLLGAVCSGGRVGERRHIPIAVPTAQAVAVEAFCSSDGLCWHMHLCAKQFPTAQAVAVEAFRSSDGLCWHTYLRAKQVPTARTVAVEAFCSSDSLCRSEAHPRAPGLEDDAEEPTSACPLSDAGRAVPGHPTPSPLSNLLRHRAQLVAFPTSAVERRAPAPPKPPGPT